MLHSAILFGSLLGSLPALNAHFLIESVELLNETIYPSNTEIDGSPIGGLSGITYDHTRNVYYMIVDDLNEGTQRYLTATIDMETYEVVFTNSTTLKREDGSFFGNLDFDGESIRYTQNDTLIITSERYPLGIYEFGLDGLMIRSMFLPGYHYANTKPNNPNITYGVIDNEGAEGASFTLDNVTLWVAYEAALYQDGPRATPDNPTAARWYSIDSSTGVPTGVEYVAVADATSVSPIPEDGFQISGWTEILCLDREGHNFLALDRSFAVGGPNHDVRLYEVSFDDATNVYGRVSLPDNYTAGTKKLLADFRKDFGIISDNLEGLELRPVNDTEAILIVISDDNFNDVDQFNQFLFLKLTGNFTEWVSPPSTAPSSPLPSSRAGPGRFLSSSSFDPGSSISLSNHWNTIWMIGVANAAMVLTHLL